MISVIVPVYNSERYLEDCIDSLLNQSCEDIEILFVDDGSTDSSCEICRKYERIYRRIKYIRKSNGGVSSARNMGLEIAEGEYVTFVDSDDYLADNILKTAINILYDESLDLIMWNAIKVIDNNFEKCQEIKFTPLSEEFIDAALISNYHDGFYLGDFIRAVWGKIYRLDVIKRNNLLFNEELYIGEDAVFLMRYFSKVKKIKAINFYGYYYRILDSSAVRRFKSDLLYQSIIQIEQMESILAKGNIAPIVQSSLCILSWRILHDLYLNEKQQNNKIPDSKLWYQLMREKKYKCLVKPKWASKLVQLQIRFGVKIPYTMQIEIIDFYDWLRGRVVKKKYENIRNNDN